MSRIEKSSLEAALARVEYLPDRTPEMAFEGGAERAFTELAKLGVGGVYLTHYSGDSEWERHSAGDELVLALDGTTTVVLFEEEAEVRIPLGPRELVVVPAGTWHRFEGSQRLQVLTVTPQPTDHRLEWPTD